MLLLHGINRRRWVSRRRAVAAVESRLRLTDQCGWTRDGDLGIILAETPRVGADALGSELLELLAGAAVPEVTSSTYSYPDDWGGAGGDKADADRSGDREDMTDRRPRLGRFPLWKRAMDVLFSLFGAVVLAPIILAVVLCICLSSPGPIVFSHPRAGYGGRPFGMKKFRSMRHGASDALHAEHVKRMIERAGVEGASGAKLQNDPRVTPVGRFLRKWSLDEIPQLWNVLRGEMSLVGPRPDPVYATESYRPWYHRRTLASKPGVTGAWQVSARSRVTFEEMVRIDLRYAHRIRLFTDIRLLLATIRAVLGTRGAS